MAEKPAGYGFISSPEKRKRVARTKDSRKKLMNLLVLRGCTCAGLGLRGEDKCIGCRARALRRAERKPKEAKP